VSTALLAPDTLLAPDPAEEREIQALSDELSEIGLSDEPARLVGPGGEAIDLPPSVFHALQRVVDAMRQGLTITLVPHGKELTTKQAADLLHVSRPFLVRNLLGRRFRSRRSAPTVVSASRTCSPTASVAHASAARSSIR
jgi:hypothetical protein